MVTEQIETTLIKHLETNASWQQRQHRMAQHSKSHPYSSCVAIETVKKPAKRENKNLLLLLEPQNRILLMIKDLGRALDAVTLIRQ